SDCSCFVDDVVFYLFFFFFSSRRRHTRFDCDWSSDVCSSDLTGRSRAALAAEQVARVGDRESSGLERELQDRDRVLAPLERVARSEERRVGKECRSRWSPYDENKKKSTREKRGIMRNA